MKKWFNIALIFCLICIMAACGGKTEQPASLDASKDQVTLRVFGFKEGAEIGMLNELNKRFMDENKNIKIEYEGKLDAQGYTDILNTRLASNEAADVIMAHLGGWMDPYVKADYFIDMSGEPWVSKLGDVPSKEAKVNEKVYSLPVDMVALGVYYNTDMFTKQGLKVPKNWKEFQDVCKALSTAGITPMAISKDTIDLLGFVIPPNNVYQQTPDFDEKMNAGQAKFTQQEGWKRSFEMMYQMQTEKWMTKDLLGVPGDQAMNDFVSGKAAMFVHGTWMLDSLKKANPSFQLSMFPFPANETGDPVSSSYVGIAWSINKKTKQADAARKYVEFWSQQQTQEIWVDGKGFSSLKGVSLKIVPELQEQAQALANGKSWRFLNAQWKADPKYHDALTNLLVSGDVNASLKMLDTAADFSREQRATKK